MKLFKQSCKLSELEGTSVGSFINSTIILIFHVSALPLFVNVISRPSKASFKALINVWNKLGLY